MIYSGVVLDESFEGTIGEVDGLLLRSFVGEGSMISTRKKLNTCIGYIFNSISSWTEKAKENFV
jgi:hypothetical protein